VKGLVPARAQNRLAQPLEAESKEQRADDEAERPDRDVLESRSECGDDRGEHEGRGADAHQCRAPAADDPDREHDRQCLHRLDGTCEEGGEEEEDVVRHGGCAHTAGGARAAAPRLTGRTRLDSVELPFV
jgi:hypothetical protein